MKNLEKLFEHQLKNLYSTETRLSKALPIMAAEALAFPAGPIREKYGLWDKYVK